MAPQTPRPSERPGEAVALLYPTWEAGMTMVRSKDEIPDEAYRKMVLTLIDKQASREVATAEVFGQCVLFAPTVEDKIRITRFQHEELKHFQPLSPITSDLRVDTEAYVKDRQPAGARLTGDEADMQIRERHHRTP